ncbi:MAG TPA: NADH-quinone oxidoreductase subunit NuoG [Acidimicrobiia bacterium]|nr:NADH-quinone oxidoreductase subunit NuoG [Acidimicrobiia bacterium]
MSELVKVTIDGKEIEAEKGELLIKAAQRAGVFIPRFCWHERMKPVGMCRMCLVEIEGVRGLPPACTTPVADGMVVHMHQENVEQVQDGVLELLLINHPLDCPVCDRGGECPLQDQTLAFGPGESRFVEEKRHWEKPIALSDLVLLDRERCIQCARCTRFADEIAGDPLITFTERGGQTEIATFPDEPFASYFSGNTVQICPVGALTAKPYRFKARPWDLSTVESSCNQCAVQCRVALQSTSNQLVRMLGVDSEGVNQGWLCDKGRYGFQYVHSTNRITAPRVRRGGEAVEATWPEALDSAADILRQAIDLHGPQSVAVLGGARGTNEDAYVWARLVKGVLRTDNVDAQLGDGLPADVVLGMPRARIGDCDTAAAILLLAPDLKEELPVLYLRVRRAAEELGVPLIDVSVRDHGLTRYADAVLRHVPGQAADVMARLAAALDGSYSGDAMVDAAAALIRDRVGDLIVVLGRPSLAEGAEGAALAAAVLAARPNVRFLSALRRGNVHGALDLGLTPGFLPGRTTLADASGHFAAAWGAVPEEIGLDAAGILQAATQSKLQVLVLLGADPLADFPDRVLAQHAIDRVPSLIVVDAFATNASERADVFLPAALYGEKAGSVTNLEGRVQRLGRKVAPQGTSMADWRIAAELALRFDADFDLVSIAEVQDEIARVAPAYAGVDAAVIASARDGVVVPWSPDRGALVTGPAEPGSGHSWDPIPPGRDATVLPDDRETDPGESGDVVAPVDAAPEVVGALPPVYEWVPAAAAASNVPARDAHALRLVAGRTLYDAGRSCVESSSIAHLASPAVLRVNRSDLDRIGVVDGGHVKVTSSRGTQTLTVEVDDVTAAGTAFLAVTQQSPGAQDLVDAGLLVTDLRVETIR